MAGLADVLYRDGQVANEEKQDGRFTFAHGPLAHPEKKKRERSGDVGRLYGVAIGTSRSRNDLAFERRRCAS